MSPISEADILLAHEILDEFLRDFYVPPVFNDGALRRRIAGALTRVRAEEREACAKEAESYQPQHELNTAIGRQIGQNIACAIRALGEVEAK